MKLNVKSLADVEIGFPVIAEGTYHAKIVSAEVKPNKTGDGNNLVVQFLVLDTEVLTHGKGLPIANKGQLKLTRYFSLKPTADYDPDTAVKELQVAIRKPAEEDLSSEELPNKIVMIKVAHKPAEKDPRTGKEYPEGNDIKRVTPVPEDDGFQPPPFA